MYLFIYANRKLQLNAGFLKESYRDSKLKENGLYPEINFYRKLKGGQASLTVNKKDIVLLVLVFAVAFLVSWTINLLI